MVGGVRGSFPLGKRWGLGESALRRESGGFSAYNDETRFEELSAFSVPCGNLKFEKEFRSDLVVVEGIRLVSMPTDGLGWVFSCEAARCSANDVEDRMRGEGTVKARSCSGAD